MNSKYFEQFSLEELLSLFQKTRDELKQPDTTDIEESHRQEFLNQIAIEISNRKKHLIVKDEDSK